MENFEDLIKQIKAEKDANPFIFDAVGDLLGSSIELYERCEKLEARVDKLEQSNKPAEQSNLILPKEVWEFISAVNFCYDAYDSCSGCPYSDMDECTVVFAEKAEELLKKYSCEVTE